MKAIVFAMLLSGCAVGTKEFATEPTFNVTIESGFSEDELRKIEKSFARWEAINPKIKFYKDGVNGSGILIIRNHETGNPAFTASTFCPDTKTQLIHVVNIPWDGRGNFQCRMTHEIGHVLQLPHVDDGHDVMHINCDDVDGNEIGSEDVNTLERKWGF
jgi:hypothetical protein